MEKNELFYGNTRICRGDIRYNTKNNHEVVGVITAADKPAGRGQKLKYSAVYALNNLPLLQPINLKDEDFLSELKSLNATTSRSF
jgi:methionyl-tRNA formyltransferase